ncbi:DNA-processing protein DprA [Steroidobacter flavus]|uniref:DNA-processing protein DprA n=1 Tax=Steroidobacter flavus TaxID=1842136 RepID=A0ABV8SV10_9GAMM
MDELKKWLEQALVPGYHAGTQPQLLERHLRWLDHPAHHFIPRGSARYPALLAASPDAPTGLLVRGNPDALSLPQLAIVGSRNPSQAGHDIARRFATHLARSGLTITSGLAIGIDTAAHRGALDGGGLTIAVCGTGLDIDYPRANAGLSAEIASGGALVSEFPLGTPASRSNFPRRNRIISGLSLGTLVVEAAVRSGSLITARLAAEQGREVFAIPGSIHNPLSRGCHKLIREGAQLVETADDIFAELGPLAAALTPTATKTAESTAVLAPALDKGYEILLDALGFEPASVDVLIARTGLKADEVASMLLILELEARIDACPGGRYARRTNSLVESGRGPFDDKAAK